MTAVSVNLPARYGRRISGSEAQAGVERLDRGPVRNSEDSPLEIHGGASPTERCR